MVYLFVPCSRRTSVGGKARTESSPRSNAATCAADSGMIRRTTRSTKGGPACTVDGAHT